MHGAVYDEPVVKVVSLNVNCDGQTQRRGSLRFEKRFPYIAEFLKEQDADVLILNELRDYPSEGAHHVALVERTFSASHQTCAFRHNDSASSFLNLVLVHRRLGAVVEQRHLWPTTAADGGGGGPALSPTFALVRDARERQGRSVGVCAIALHRRSIAGSSDGDGRRMPEPRQEPSGQRLIVAAFHAGVADNDKRRQYAAVALLTSLYPGLPLLLAGDFNVFAEDAPDELFACLRRASLCEVTFDDAPGTFIPYSHEAQYERIMRLPPSRLDRMFVAGALRVAESAAATAERGRRCWTHPVYVRGGCHDDAGDGGRCKDVDARGGCVKEPPPDADAWKKQFPVDGLASDHFALVAVLAVGPSVERGGK